MHQLHADAYKELAATLPRGLNTAIKNDLGVTPEQYLADADAAGQASGVVQSLKEQGVHILGYRMEGTQLKVNVRSAADVPAVQASGAVAAVGAGTSDTPPDLAGKTFTAMSTDSGDGWGYPLLGTSWAVCSTGFNGYSATGTPEFVTAGHCGATIPGGTAVYAATKAAPNSWFPFSTAPIGATAGGSFHVGDGRDAGLITTNSNAAPEPYASEWDGSKTPITGVATAVTGAPVCKSGGTSGWTCGTVLAVDQMLNVVDTTNTTFQVNSIVTNACVKSGDSGGALLMGTRAVGVTSSAGGDCAVGSFGNFFPLQSASDASVASTYGSGFELAVQVPAPQPMTPANGQSVTTAPTLSGKFAGGTSGEVVHLRLNGGAEQTQKVTADGASWSFAIQPQPGRNTYQVWATYGARSKSSAVDGSFTLPAAAAPSSTPAPQAPSNAPAPAAPSKAPAASAPSSTRIAGADRYGTAAAISKAGFSGSARVAYVASGANFPDALSASAAAAKQVGPLLLTMPGALPSSTRAELVRLKPSKVVIAGGAASVSDAVMKAIAALPGRPAVVRVAGADRYATSQAIAKYAFGAGITKAFVASGSVFPDALSASAPAGTAGEPVVLVSPASAASAGALLKKLGAKSVSVVGGPASVSNSTMKALAIPAVRLSGADRYATNDAVVKANYSAAPSIVIASGIVFPDALSGSVLAAARLVPVMLSPSACVAPQVLTEMSRLHATNVTILGGTSSLSTSVASLRRCG